MDLDDIFPQKSQDSVVGADISQLSVSDLEDRIAELRQEIARLEKELSARQSFRSAAEQAFKS
ncbi:MAG: DUF1192 domain-containing protein [Hyphomicrobiaceae bacterium]